MTAFTQTWDTSWEGQPPDSQSASQGALRIRNTRLATRERLEVDHSLAGDAHDGAHLKVSLKKQTGDPSEPASGEYGILYVKDDGGGVPELYFKDDAANVFQLTDGGELLLNGLKSSQFLRSDVADTVAGILTFSATNEFNAAQNFNADVDIDGTIDVSGDIFVGNSGGGDSSIHFHDDNSNTERTLRWDDSENDWRVEDSGGTFRTLWHSGNDGAGSGLHADLLDGQHGSYYLSRSNHTGSQTLSTISDAGTLAGLNSVGASEIDSGAVGQSELQSGAVARTHLDVQTASTAGTVGSQGQQAITLNAYAFFPMIHIQENTDTWISGHETDGASADNPRFAFYNSNSSTGRDYDVDHRYIDA